MPSYLQKTGHIDGRLPAPEIVAAAADLTRHMLNADPKRLIHSEAVARRAESFTLTTSLRTRATRHGLSSDRQRSLPAEHRVATSTLQPGRPPFRGAFRRQSPQARPGTKRVPVLPGRGLRRLDRRRPNHWPARRTGDPRRAYERYAPPPRAIHQLAAWTALCTTSSPLEHVGSS
jgi:hypothetical protein